MTRVIKWATDIDHTWTVPRARGVKTSRVIRDVSMMRFVRRQSMFLDRINYVRQD
jgi:hypothetical protein